MAATMAPTLAESHPTIRRPVLRPFEGSLRSRGSIAALGLLVALLIAMIPGLARVPGTTAEPQSLAAPAIWTTTQPLATVFDLTIADPAPQPGPHPDR